MSRHLQILPILRSTAAKLRQPAAGKENDEINTERKRSRRKLGKPEKNKVLENCGENYLNLEIDEKANQFEIERIGDSCETPKSDKNKIPKALECPQAPKKPIRRIGCVSCKRKLMPELKFFEADRRKEVDEFFRSSLERMSEAVGKRKCSSDAAVASAADLVKAGTTCAVSTESSSSSSPA